MDTPGPIDYGHVIQTRRPRKLLGGGIFVLVLGIMGIVGGVGPLAILAIVGVAMIASAIMTGD